MVGTALLDHLDHLVLLVNVALPDGLGVPDGTGGGETADRPARQ